MLHDMPVGFVPGTAGLVPGIVAVSSPRTLSPSAASRVVPNHRFNMANVDCIRTFVRIHYPTGRRHTVATVSSPVVPAPPDSVATVPPGSVATFPPDSVATAAASLPTISSMLSKSAISVANASKNKMADAAGCMADVDSNVQHRQVTLKNQCI